MREAKVTTLMVAQIDKKKAASSSAGARRSGKHLAPDYDGIVTTQCQGKAEASCPRAIVVGLPLWPFTAIVYLLLFQALDTRLATVITQR